MANTIIFILNTYLLIFILNFRKALNDSKELKLLLDMYKGVSKDQRDKVQLMATEKKLKSEIEDLRNQLKKMQVSSNRHTYYIHFITFSQFQIK